MNRRLVWASGLVVVVGVIGLGWLRADAQEKKNAELRAFMRQKLEASTQILEGLTTEDASLVKQGADTLVKMSSAEQWRVTNDMAYRQFSDDFQRTTRKLSAAADKGNFDDVTLKWIDTTLSCVECHKFVRGIRLADRR